MFQNIALQLQILFVVNIGLVIIIVFMGIEIEKLHKEIKDIKFKSRFNIRNRP